MSFFGKLFGKGSDKDPVTTGEAIQKLRETEDMLMKKQVCTKCNLSFIISLIVLSRNFSRKRSTKRLQQPERMPRQTRDLPCKL